MFNRYTSKQTYRTVPPSLGTPEEARRTVETAEADFEARLVALSAAVSRECAEDGIRILRLTGPTCSGKTTAAGKLTEALEAAGLSVYPISLDDFYLDRQELEERARARGGTPDYDSADTLDLGAMEACVRYGWMLLTDSSEWKPNKYVTRAEFAADLARFAGIHETYPTAGAAIFSDVDPSGADAPYISWAAGCGILQGYADGTFRPDGTLTREQMAVILARYYALLGQRTSGSADGYADAGRISAWAKDGVAACTGLGLVQGDARGRFLPRGKLTRAQIAAILVRMAA